ncbi:MAG: hypothetical protein H6818_13865 [Phycisphaerales bacterium]|nr:hypothetical protein [Phycisphaerales bacterium]MCB9862111.1 hypothetical protein [Phycisphaerales bacterium]
MPKYLYRTVHAIAIAACLNMAAAPKWVFAYAPDNTSEQPEPESKDEPKKDADEPAEDSNDSADEKAEAETVEKPRVDYGPTELGVRMTPAIAKAISSSMTRRMKDRYSLDDKQVEKATDAIQYQIMKLAHENATVGRDAFELMMATMISNDGEMPKEDAVEFAKTIKPLIPALRQFFLDSSADVGKIMSLKQRLQFTGDMTAVTAGVGVFEARMNRWEAGEVADGANPFFDRPVTPDDDDQDVEGDSKESRELRRARRDVDRSMAWTINVEANWEQYVRNAIIFYDFDEKQQASANGILEECKARAAKVKTDEWLKDYRENRVADRLSWRLDSKFNQGPFRFQLERSYDKLMKPLNDIAKELKRRIETLPTSKQKAEARKAAEKAMQERGLESLPI